MVVGGGEVVVLPKAKVGMDSVACWTVIVTLVSSARALVDAASEYPDSTVPLA